MTGQSALTIVVPVAVERKAALRTLLKGAGADPAYNDLVPFGRLPGTHFGRMLILDESEDLRGASISPLLMLMADVDGPADDYLERLVEVSGSGLDTLFAGCDGYPTGPAQAPAAAARIPGGPPHQRGRLLRQHCRADGPADPAGGAAARCSPALPGSCATGAEGARSVGRAPGDSPLHPERAGAPLGAAAGSRNPASCTSCASLRTSWPCRWCCCRSSR